MAQPVTIASLSKKVVACQSCKRLRNHCLKIAEEKRRAYQNETYWGKPIPGFGDPKARLILFGLAPAAHGANRTGRIFTGDRSGDWLYRALHKAGFANQAHATHRDDGLKLLNAYITCSVKWAPPDNKPLPAEMAKCSPFLEAEIAAMPQAEVYLVLGQIALNALWPLLTASGVARGAKPKFSHGGSFTLREATAGIRPLTLLMSYHPSQQNTFTGRLTEPMFDSVFAKARRVLGID